MVGLPPVERYVYVWFSSLWASQVQVNGYVSLASKYTLVGRQRCVQVHEVFEEPKYACKSVVGKPL